MIKNLSKREKYLVGITFVVALLGFTKYYYIPYSAKIKENHIKVVQLKSEVSRSETELKVASELHQRSVASRNPVVSSQLDEIDQKNFAQFLNVLTEKSGLEGLDVREIRLVKTSETAKFKVSNIELTIESSFLNVGKFLERLEQSSLVVKVGGIKMFRLKNDMRRVEARLELEGYVSK